MNSDVSADVLKIVVFYLKPLWFSCYLSLLAFIFLRLIKGNITDFLMISGSVLTTSICWAQSVNQLLALSLINFLTILDAIY